MKGWFDKLFDKSEKPDSNGYVVKRDGKQLHPGDPHYDRLVAQAEAMNKRVDDLFDDPKPGVGIKSTAHKSRGRSFAELQEDLANEQRQRWQRVVNTVDDFCNRHDIREDLQADLLHGLRAAITGKRQDD